MSTVGRINFGILFLGLGLFFIPFLSHAQVFINEIMYDPAGADEKREWIEILNNSDSSIDLTGWTFNDGANHGLNTPPNNFGQGSMVVLVGGFTILTSDAETFLKEHVGFSGTVIDTVMTLKQTLPSYTIVLTKTGQTSIGAEYFINTVTNNTNNSLQRQPDGTWIPASPTPGIINTSISASVSTTTDQTSTTTDSTATTTTSQTTSANNTNTETTLSAHYGSAGLSTVESISKFEIGAGRARLGMVGTPIEFRPEMKYSYSGNMTFKWSFGDGSIGYGQVLSHSYAYPGDYVVVLNVSSPGGQAVSRVNVKIVSADISISLASAERVEVSNNSKNEINLFGRALSSQGKTFVFPEDTIIKSGQKISFASFITGLYPYDENNVSMIVVGDSLNKAFVPAIQIVENKPDDKDKKQQIEILYAKAKEIQKQLATLPKESNLAVQQPSDSNVATAFLSLNSNLTSTATTTKIAHWGWVQTIKDFFLGKK